jgi:peroxiredoxin
MSAQRTLRPGDVAADFVLPTSEGELRTRLELMGACGLVLVFLRGIW